MHHSDKSPKAWLFLKMEYVLEPKNLSPKESRALRREFINKFAVKELPQYSSVMGFGETYGNNTHNGYLWEVLRPYTLISFEVAQKLVSSMNEAFVTWDFRSVHNEKSMFKNPVACFAGFELVELINDIESNVPESIYVFNESLDYHITFTNQTVEGVGRVCLTSLTDLSETGISELMKELVEVSHFGEG